LVTALGAVGPAATSPLERALEDDSPMVRAAAAAALASVEAATPALVAAADDSVAAVRAAAARRPVRPRPRRRRSPALDLYTAAPTMP
jgi:HEAT repeat protein